MGLFKNRNNFNTVDLEDFQNYENGFGNGDYFKNKI